MIDIKQIAQQYIDAGWAVLPLVKGEKRATGAWQKINYTADKFKAGDGIAGKCGEPSGWRVDVDLDSGEAVAAAKMLLPNTGLIHGRPGKPDSHYWFICEGAKSEQFKDVKDSGGKSAMLVEIRSTGGYTAIPPSGHPSGDTLAWAIERNAMHIEPDVLYVAVREVAIVALLARHWLGAGARHAAVGHLAGFLLRAKLEASQVTRIIRAAATIANDPDLQDRMAFTGSTIAAFDAQRPVTGGPKLADALGEDVVRKLRGWLKVADVDALEAFNQRHFVVRLGKDAVIGREDDEDGVVFQQPRALNIEYHHVKVQVGVKDGEPVIKPIFPEWLGWPQRRTYRKVTFTPPPLVALATDYNLWTGFAIDPDDRPRPEDRCARILAHLHDIICSGNDDHYRYLLKWYAFAVQYPAYRAMVAIVARGVIGAGKGSAVRPLERIFGRHYIQLDKLDHLVGRFNTALSSKVIVFADEAMWAGIKGSLGAVKRIITEPTLAIERKNIDLVSERNCVHLFMATNEEWSAPASLGERRFFAINVSPTQAKQRTYFAPLNTEIDGDGSAAFLAYLLDYPTSADDVRDVPMTEELRHQQELTMPPELRWWHECLKDGVICGGSSFAGPLAFGGTLVDPDEIYGVYKGWIEAHHLHRHLLDKNVLMKVLARYMTADDPRTSVRNGKRVIQRFFTIDQARAYFDGAQGTTAIW